MLEDIDRRILSVLQEDNSLASSEVGDRVGLSQSPCWRRMQALRKDGYIKGDVALLDRQKLGYGVLVFATVRLETHVSGALEDFKCAIGTISEVQECHVLMGNIDFLLRVVARDMPDYERLFFEKLSGLPGVREINSFMVVSTSKETHQIPLGT